MLYNFVGYCKTYIRRPGVEDDYLDIIDRIALLSKPARDLFIAMKNNKGRDYNTVTLGLKDKSKTEKCRYSRLCTELKKAGLILKVKPVENILTEIERDSYMINPYWIKPLEYAIATYLWKSFGGKPMEDTYAV